MALIHILVLYKWKMALNILNMIYWWVLGSINFHLVENEQKSTDLYTNNVNQYVYSTGNCLTLHIFMEIELYLNVRKKKLLSTLYWFPLFIFLPNEIESCMNGEGMKKKHASALSQIKIIFLRPLCLCWIFVWDTHFIAPNINENYWINRN